MAPRPQAQKSQGMAAGRGRPGDRSARRPATGGGPRWRGWLLGAVVALAAFLPHARSLGYDFVWDDRYLIGPHLDVHGPADVARLWGTPFDVYLKDAAVGRTYFRPVTIASLALDRALWGEDARGYHAQNLVWYVLGCLALWLLAWELSGRPLAATAGAVLFALHPTHPESAAFISGRTDLIAGAFLFASLWVAARHGPRIHSPWAKLLPASLLLLPGLFAKEVALFGAPLPLAALWVKDRPLTVGGLARAAAPVAAVCALYLAARTATLGPSQLPAVPPVQGTVPQLLTSVAIVAIYVGLLLVPLGLSARHDIREVPGADLLFVAGLVVIGALAAGIARAARRRSPWLLPLGLFAATLLPICWVRILAGALVAERFLFVPGGALALAVALLPGVWERAPRSAPAGVSAAAAPRDAGAEFLAVCGAVAIWFLVLLLPRVAIWKDEPTLFTSILHDSPESAHVHGLLGNYYYLHRDLPRAAEHFRRAHAIFPAAGEMLLNLGAAEDEMGQTDSAFVHVRELIAMQPDYAPGWYALGNLDVRVDRPDSASAAFREAIRLDPRFAEAENNLGVVLERMGRYDEALEHYRRSGEVRPGYPDAARNLARLGAMVDSLRRAGGR
jgi:protein O-mannosyl-transferase